MNDMMRILTASLSEKAVVDTEGTPLGSLYNISLNFETGQLHELIIRPHTKEQHSETDADTDDKQYLRIPVDHVQTVEDHIIVHS